MIKVLAHWETPLPDPFSVIFGQVCRHHLFVASHGHERRCVVNMFAQT